jgi:hypothetical protein
MSDSITNTAMTRPVKTLSGRPLTQGPSTASSLHSANVADMGFIKGGAGVLCLVEFSRGHSPSPGRLRGGG